MRTRSLLIVLATVFCVATSERGHGADKSDPKPLPPASTKAVDFVRDIQPIFQRSCIRCHGEEKQKGDYRLDVREIAFNKGESYAPNIIPQKSADSPLIKFVSGTGDLLMPPEGNLLSDEEIGLLRAWIDSGAKWPDEVAGTVRDPLDLWSLKPLVKPPVPKAANDGEHLSPIDAFVHQKLAEQKIHSSPEANRRTLVRRVHFDMTGLPPTPQEVEAFVSDADQRAYEKLVDRLLESPRYGERWARHWIDAAHFAETHGHDQDRIRENAWPYRDYLIAAFNNDTPYARFIQEQIAADAFFPEEPALTAALGFLAAGPWDESSLRDIREDTLDRQIARYLDRDDMLSTVMNNVVSMTVQCSRCHDHKFDPIPQRDYYSLQAVFSGVERANRKYDADLQIHRQRTELATQKRELEQRQPTAMAALASPDIQQRIAEWERELKSHIPQWQTVVAESAQSSDGATLTKLDDGSILASGPRPEKDNVTIVSASLASFFQTEPQQTSPDNARSARITAIRLDVLTDDSLPLRGPGRQDNGNFHLSEFEVYLDDRDQPETLVNPSADFNQTSWEIAKAIDQNESTAWGIHPKEGQPHFAFFELKEPVTARDDSGGTSANDSANPRTASRLRIILKQQHGRSHLIGRMKISICATPTPIRVDVQPEAVQSILEIAQEKRTEEQKNELARFVRLKELERTISSLPKPNLVYAAAADFEPDGAMHPPPGPRPIHLLHRGDIRAPRDEIAPGSLSCVSAVPTKFEIPSGSPESSRRAALARWLTDRDNPLTWRSIVNRIWYHHFGRGIVGTLNDFGHMGESPSHPELLDWLAAEFRDGGQSLKTLHRMILTSRTYRQCVNVADPRDLTRREKEKDGGIRRLTPPPRLEEMDRRLTLDADNRLLWRMNRTRLDAECIRDAVLAIAGRLDLRMGGPSDRQFDLKPGIHVTPSVDYGKFDINSELGRRRSIYRFLFRTLPDPFMESLDCPSGDQITPARGNNVTVQQALALWNDAFIAAHCEHIASRIQREVAEKPSKSNAAEIDLAVQLIFGRSPTAEETQDFVAYSTKHGLANLCRLLLNSNEFLFVN